MNQQDINRIDVVSYLSHGIAKNPAFNSEGDGIDGADLKEDEVNKKEDALTAYAVNLNEKAKSGKIDPLIGRQKEVDRTIQVLCRRTKNNPLLVGDSGVGKTAIAEVWRARLLKKLCQRCWKVPSFIPLIWGLYWQVHVTAAILKNGLRRS